MSTFLKISLATNLLSTNRLTLMLTISLLFLLRIGVGTRGV
jgi:hypothetical protein